MHKKIPRICTGCRISKAKIYLYHSTEIAKAKPHSKEWQTDTSIQKQWSMDSAFVWRWGQKWNSFWNLPTFISSLYSRNLPLKFSWLHWIQELVHCKKDQCLVLLQVPKCFGLVQNFCARPKIYLRIVAVTNI